MDPLHHERTLIAEAILEIRAMVRSARTNHPDDIDQRQASILLTELETVEDRAARMLGEKKKLPAG